MLVLTRKEGEEIVIGDDITITVLDFRGDAIRLGIDAPKHVSIHRKEVWLAVKQRGRTDATHVPAMKAGRDGP